MTGNKLFIKFRALCNDWQPCRRVDGLAGHAVDVSGHAALYRAERLTILRQSDNQLYSGRTV